ncbi:MAG: rod shape-determining protein MreD [Xanthomonadales bacterium]|nr:rod shape-determining protein MreD [Xanthomonadales bacterium]
MSPRRERLSTLLLVLGLAVLLALLPLPGAAEPLRPYWVGLVLLYWALEVREMVSLGMAFLVGLALDVLTGSLMGLNALSLVVLIYLVQRFRARLRFFPPWQQALAVLGLLINDRIIRLWISSLMGEPLPTWHYWISPLVGMALWPWLFLLLDRVRAGRRRRAG